MKKTVTSIGEILWDVFPEGKKAGGSSMNVALNLHKQGVESKFISAVGDDESGQELVKTLSAQNFDTEFIQIHPNLPTSWVLVKLDFAQQATYTIVEPVAWDELVLTDKAIEAVKSADCFVYCSLTCRNEKSRNTIISLLNYAKFKVFDINLREPFYTFETLKTLLSAADLLKVNEHELIYLQKELALTGTTDEQLLKQLSKNFNIPIICLTVGDKGAFALFEDELYHHSGYKVEVMDTVGAGDAFLSTFISSYLKGYPMNTILDRACKVGAFVAANKGANPVYGDEVFN